MEPQTIAMAVSWSTVAISAGLALLVWVRRPPPQLWPSLFLYYIIVFVFSLSENMTSFVVSQEWYWPWMVMLYTAAMCLTPGFWVVALQFSAWVGQPVRWAGPWVRYGPFGVMAVFWLIMVSNPWHGRFIIARYRELNTYLPLWYVEVSFSYAVLCSALGLLVHLSWKTRGTRFASHAATLVVAAVVPFAANVLYVLRIIKPVPEPSVMAMSGSGLLMAFVIYRGRLFALSKISPQRLIASDADAVITLDETGQLHNANSAARTLLGAEAYNPVSMCSRSWPRDSHTPTRRTRPSRPTRYSHI